jgi:hypothetical protein
VQAFRSPRVQTPVLYDERSGEACADLKTNGIHLSERSLVAQILRLLQLFATILSHPFVSTNDSRGFAGLNEITE